MIHDIDFTKVYMQNQTQILHLDVHIFSCLVLIIDIRLYGFIFLVIFPQSIDIFFSFLREGESSPPIPPIACKSILFLKWLVVYVGGI